MPCLTDNSFKIGVSLEKLSINFQTTLLLHFVAGIILIKTKVFISMEINIVKNPNLRFFSPLFSHVHTPHFEIPSQRREWKTQWQMEDYLPLEDPK